MFTLLCSFLVIVFYSTFFLISYVCVWPDLLQVNESMDCLERSSTDLDLTDLVLGRDIQTTGG